MKRYVLVVLWIGIVFGSIVGAILICHYRLLFWDWDGQPYCHKQIDFAFMRWQEPHKFTQTVFPNIDGSSAKSLAEIHESFGEMKVEEMYLYVPGLRRDDPGDLVLMYFARPTRWTWHGGPLPTIFRSKGWIMIPVDMRFYGAGIDREGGPGEFSEWVSFEEFKQRLQKTLDFLRDNERPNWEAVVEEHKRFLGRAENY